MAARRWFGVILASLMMEAGVAAADDGVLVFGGTGRLGARIVALLTDQGHVVTVFARDGSNTERLDGLPVNYVIGDLRDADSVAAAFAGRNYRFLIDATSRGASREPFYDTAMANILSAAQGQPIRQFILHGSAGAGANAARFPNADFSRMRTVMQAKGRAERLLIESGIGYTIIRNGLIQPDRTSATGKAYLTENQGVFGNVTRADLASLTLRVFDSDEYLNRIVHAADDTFPVPPMFRNP